MSAPPPASHIWGMPLLLGAVSLVGLLSALLGNGVWDVVSWLALGFSNGIVLWYVIRSGWNKMFY